jgi:hypothetical protein
MELVPVPGAVSHHNRMETDILEALQSHGAGHLGVEAAGAKLSETLLHRAVIDGIVGRDGRTARLAADHVAALFSFVSHVISSDLVSAREDCRSARGTDAATPPPPPSLAAQIAGTPSWSKANVW